MRCVNGGKHRWSVGWICEDCGIRRADYEKDREADRPKFWIVEHGKKQKKFSHLARAKEFAETLESYKIIRVSDVSRKVWREKNG